MYGIDLDGDCMLCSRVWFSPSSIGPRPRRTRSRNGPNGTSTVNGCNGRGVPASLLYGMPTENILIHLRVDIARHVRQAVRAEEEGLNVEILECDIESNVKTRKLLDIVEAGHVSLMRLKGIENGAGETNDY